MDCSENDSDRSVVIIGDGGHARALSAITGVRCISLMEMVPSDAAVIIGMGDIRRRKILYHTWRDDLAGVVAKSAVVDGVDFIGPGVQIMPGAIIMPGASIGDNVLINTGAQIDHDCVIGNHCIISPGAVLCGGVYLEDSCRIGAGAVILEKVCLTSGTSIPAGALVVSGNDVRRLTKA